MFSTDFSLYSHKALYVHPKALNGDSKASDVRSKPSNGGQKLQIVTTHVMGCWLVIFIPPSIKNLNNINFLCSFEDIYYFCSCICLQKPRKGLVGGCSLYEKGVYQTLCLWLLVILAKLPNNHKAETAVNVHGWYIITSRGLSYICDIPRKEQYIPIAWASALSVSDCWAMREASSSEMDDWNVPRILFVELNH